MPSFPCRRTLISGCVAAALSQLALPAAADSGTGVDTSMGNALNPAPVNPLTAGSPHTFFGMYFGLRHAPERSPTGQLYDYPREPTPMITTTESGWEYFGHVEGGLLGVDGDRKSYGFRRYKDLDNGLYLNSFGLSGNKKSTASFFEVTGGGVARDDQFYALQFGRYNDWKVRAFYNETPHVFTTTFRSIYDGVGSGQLTLKPGLTPGGTASTAADNAAVAAVANANANVELGLTRQKGGVRLDKMLGASWSLFVSAASEKREGARPFGSVWGGGGGNTPIETVEPIDYNTHDLAAGVSYKDERNALNIQAAASLFRNNIGELTFQVPYRVNAAPTNGIAPGGFTQGRFDLYPDNDYYSIKAEYARELPALMRGRFTALVSMASSRQNDPLIPSTPIAGVALTNVTGNNWDSTASLSRQTSNAQIDSRLIDLGLALAPTSSLSVKAKLRHYETDNKTEYLACNPNATYVDADPYTAGNQPGGLSAYGCTGVWGRLINEGSGSAVVLGTTAAANATTLANGAAGNQNIRNVPFDYKRANYGIAADYRLARAGRVEAGYEREEYKRTHRERAKTTEDKFKLGYVNRGFEHATLRVSYEYGDRDGSAYNADVYEEFVSAALLPIPTGAVGVTTTPNLTSWVVHMNSRTRKYELADRRQSTLNARMNFMAGEVFDWGVALQYKGARYPDSEYGRTDRQEQTSASLDLNYQPSPEAGLYAYYTYQNGKMNQRSVPSGAAVGGNCNLGAVGGPATVQDAILRCPDPNSGFVFDAANAYSVSHKDEFNVLGFGVRYGIGAVQTHFSYGYSQGKTKIGYTLPANLAPAAAALAGAGMPDLKTTEHLLEANVLWAIDKRWTARFLVRHEIGRIRDWHYLGFETTPVSGNPAALPTAVILDAGPVDYSATVLGVFVLYRL